jgi:serine phosphatase RsbU (regulator of sigma subunit)
MPHRDHPAASGVFREACELSDEQFVTALLAEVSADGTKIELLSCGHPAPLLLGPARPRFIGPEEGSLKLGLRHLAGVPRLPVTIAFEPGDALLFYTDGASEARNKAGVFFPLADNAAVRAPPDPATLADRLGDKVIRHAGHAPDDVALLVIYRDGALTGWGRGDCVTIGNGRPPGPVGP